MIDFTRNMRAMFHLVDGASLAAFRIVFGLSAFFLMTYYYSDLRIDSISEPCLRFPVPGFSWLPPSNREWMHIEVYALRVFSLLIAIGLFYRLSVLLFFLLYGHIFTVDVTFYQNHFYLILLLLFLLFFMPAHNTFSLDSVTWRKNHGPHVPAWAIYALRGQLAVVFFFAGLAKLNGDWLLGEPLRTLIEASSAPHFMKTETSVMAMAYFGAIFDMLVAPMLLSKKTRLIAFDLSLAFHFINAQIWDIDIFPYLMIGLSLIFFDPDWPHQLWRRLRRQTLPPGAGMSTRLDMPRLTTSQTTIAVCLGMYFVVQCVLPLRHFAYPGSVLWTDEGRLFAWRMMLVKRQSVMHFYAEDDSGKRWELNLRDFRLRHNLDRLPERMLAFNAVTFAHHAAGMLAAKGHRNVQIFGEIRTSLHRRKPQLLFDPNTNLASVQISLLSTTWILPLHEALPRTKEERDAALSAWLAIGGSREAW